jgi:putative ABC transport system permease protein
MAAHPHRHRRQCWCRGGMLWGVSPTDPVTFALGAMGLTAAALLACYVPARRAAKIDPTVSLRSE